ncbi:YbaK/EbsC family protein [Microvirga roseola]|uniref:YbaK/EbsC family protein n=1 Tax=Microvirga roseola TaxID=2883126 RepID=UPI001E495880|nr:YbaK/EbsC family protein [Microvirga roseola]
MDTPLPPSAQRVQNAASELGLDVAVREMPQSTRTAEEAAAACGCEVGQIVKSLVFQGAESGKPYLLLVSGSNRVDQESVAQSIGEKLSRPDAAKVRAWTGYAIGGIPPLGHDMPIKTYIDRDLLKYGLVWAAAGTPQAVFPVDPKALAKAIGAIAIPVI